MVLKMTSCLAPAQPNSSAGPSGDASPAKGAIMNQLVVLGTSPFIDTSVAVGPFRSQERAQDAVLELEYKGYVTETVELVPASEIDFVTNDEGAEA